MKFIDDNHIEEELSDDEFMEKVEEVAIGRDMEMYGRDGIMEVYRETQKYRNIPYDISICRYYQIGVDIDNIKGMNDIGKWACLEYPKEAENLVSIVTKLHHILAGESFEYYNHNLYNFLFRDSLHSCQKHNTLRQCVNDMILEAHKSIDELIKIKKTLKKTMKKKYKKNKTFVKDFIRELKKWGM